MSNAFDRVLTSAAEVDATARRSLRRHRAFASGLLVVMAALVLASYALPPTMWRELLQSCAKAGLVGGLADWFAVTALFRHPLGIPIPHTAIIPAQKERLGRALGRFIGTHVITQDEVLRVLGRADLPGLLHRYLADPVTARPAAEAMAASLPKLLSAIEDGRAGRLISRLLPRLLGGAAAGRVVARALQGLVEGGRHQEVFTFILTQLRGMLAEKEEDLRKGIRDRVKEQGGQLLGWAIGASIAKRVISAINDELDNVGPDGSTMRAAFDEWVRREIAAMEEDPARAAEMGAAIRRVLSHESVRLWFGDVWLRLRAVVERDAVRPGGHTISFIESTLAAVGRAIEEDPAVRQGLERGIANVVAGLLPMAQERSADFVASVVSQWDARTVTERLELRVGRDLRYIRVNGTLVGFLAGGVLYLLLRAAFGTGAL